MLEVSQASLLSAPPSPPISHAQNRTNTTFPLLSLSPIATGQCRAGEEDQRGGGGSASGQPAGRLPRPARAELKAVHVFLFFVLTMRLPKGEDIRAQRVRGFWGSARLPELTGALISEAARHFSPPPLHPLAPGLITGYRRRPTCSITAASGWRPVMSMMRCTRNAVEGTALVASLE